MSNLVTGTYRVTLDGVETVHTLSAMPYEQFWLRQDTVVDALKTCSKWGMEQIFGLPPRFTESATGMCLTSTRSISRPAGIRTAATRGTAFPPTEPARSPRC